MSFFLEWKHTSFMRKMYTKKKCSNVSTCKVQWHMALNLLSIENLNSDSGPETLCSQFSFRQISLNVLYADKVSWCISVFKNSAQEITHSKADWGILCEWDIGYAELFRTELYPHSISCNINPQFQQQKINLRNWHFILFNTNWMVEGNKFKLSH